MARILKLKNAQRPSPSCLKVIEETAEALISGEAVVFPTDTVYGLLSASLNKAGSETLNRIKGRSEETPIAVLLNETKELKRLVEKLEDACKKRLSLLIPGPLTLIVDRLELTKSLSGQMLELPWKEIGFRVPAYPPLNLLIETVGGAVLATSANLTGAAEPKTLEMCKALLEKPQVSLAVDAGSLSGQPSAVVRIKGQRLEILRNHPKLALILSENA